MHITQYMKKRVSFTLLNIEKILLLKTYNNWHKVVEPLITHSWYQADVGT